MKLKFNFKFILLFPLLIPVFFQCQKMSYGPPQLEIMTNIHLGGKQAAWPKSVRILKWTPKTGHNIA